MEFIVILVMVDILMMIVVVVIMGAVWGWGPIRTSGTFLGR